VKQLKTGNFSIITPNYNMGKYLVETIESVLANLKPGDEYFIIDGGSTDNSVEIICRYQDRITGWISEKDHGYADALAKGFAKATNDYLCWINSGDFLLSGALDIARDLLDQTDFDLIFGDDLYIDENNIIINVTNGHADNLAAMMLYGAWTPLQDACFWRKSLYEKIGGINPNLKFAADYDLFLRMSLNGKNQYYPVIFSSFRRHNGQTSQAFYPEYQTERMLSRQRQLNLRNDQKLKRFWLDAYYWIIVHWRVRIQGSNLQLKHFRGCNALNINSQYF
jgi:glycosyltransferase involved in cell wall biosynthesis